MVAHSPHARTGTAITTRLRLTGHHTVPMRVTPWALSMRQAGTGAVTRCSDGPTAEVGRSR